MLSWREMCMNSQLLWLNMTRVVTFERESHNIPDSANRSCTSQQEQVLSKRSVGALEMPSEQIS